MTSNGHATNSEPAPQESTGVSFLEEALKETLALVIAEKEREWQRALKLMEAHAQAILSRFREEHVNVRSESARTVAERLSLVHDGERGPPGRDGRDGIDGKDGVGHQGPR